MSGLCNGKRLDWAEAEARKINISNTVPSICKHLSHHFLRSTASTSTSGTSKRLSNNSEKVQSTINQYIGRKLLPNEIDTFYRLLLPDETLKNSAERVQNNIEAAAKDDKYVITRSDGQVLIWGAKDISGIVEILMQQKQLRRIHNDIVFLPCFAHQTNLCVADVLKSSQRLLETSKNATAIRALKSLAGRNDLSDVTVVYEEEEGNNELEQTPLDYWSFLSDSVPELSQIAHFITSNPKKNGNNGKNKKIGKIFLICRMIHIGLIRRINNSLNLRKYASEQAPGKIQDVINSIIIKFKNDFPTFPISVGEIIIDQKGLEKKKQPDHLRTKVPLARLTILARNLKYCLG
ncbi:hypothetical protein GLOIN_2v1828503 [Rhizophagus clarus]|uniref:Uncharacterized protein n=1 Tax=Rhizophagus clarus TaxID=94130 RepID=A0A8H3QB31_9GLOM|nr:hypothetical protein GLOIN_2v1828503 [Rhizophagus clarus]